MPVSCFLFSTTTAISAKLTQQKDSANPGFTTTSKHKEIAKNALPGSSKMLYNQHHAKHVRQDMNPTQGPWHALQSRQMLEH